MLPDPMTYDDLLAVVPRFDGQTLETGGQCHEVVDDAARNSAEVVYDAGYAP